MFQSLQDGVSAARRNARGRERVKNDRHEFFHLRIRTPKNLIKYGDTCDWIAFTNASVHVLSALARCNIVFLQDPVS